MDICRMKMLIVAATSREIEQTIRYLETKNSNAGKNECKTLITGIGGIAVTYKLIKLLSNQKPDFMIQAGLAGSFRAKIPIGSVVCVHEELMGDMGAEENNEFRDAFDLRLVSENEPPFTGKILTNTFAESHIQHGLPLTRSVTVNEITTREDRINQLRKKYDPDIESMEGAAFHYVCLQEKIPFLQVRSISNYVGERNKEKWGLKVALDNLNEKLVSIIHSEFIRENSEFRIQNSE